MKIHFSKSTERGLTLTELLVILGVIFVLWIMIIPPGNHRKDRAFRIQCVNNLKQIALGCRLWEGDNTDKFPMAVSQTNGGTMEFITGPNVWRHYQAMSNELGSPVVLFCPSERSRMRATNFAFLNNSNISYFVGVDAYETNATMILSGDRNLTNGTPVQDGLLTLTTNAPGGWTAEMHNKVGNIVVADGHVEMLNASDLRGVVADTELATNRLQMPILSP